MHVPQPDPGVQRRGDECVRIVCGPTFLTIPAFRAMRRTIRAAPWRSSRRQSGARKMGPAIRLPTARSIARAVRCQRYCDDLAALAGDHQRPVPALDGQGVDIGANGFGYPQPVQG